MKKPYCNRFLRSIFNKPQSNQGFTIVELVIVVAVIGVLATVVTLAYRGATANSYVATSAQQAGVYLLAAPAESSSL